MNWRFPINRKNSPEEELRVTKKHCNKTSNCKVDSPTIVAPSEWLAAEARKSEVLNHIHCIHMV
jgi:hypothetical protein